MNKILLVLLSFLVLSCQQQPKNNVEAKKDTINSAFSEMHNAKTSLDYIGSYKGILPCADCEGLETEIVINENDTYSIKKRYQGKGFRVFVQKGNFIWNKEGNVIILTNVKNEPNQYFVGENTLTQLDLSGQKITGNLASQYILSKQSNNSTTAETIDENSTSTVDLNNRIATTTVIKKVNPAIGKFTLAETKWKLASLNNVAIVQKSKKVNFLKLNSKDGRFIAYMGCNSISGSYAMPMSTKIVFSNAVMTRMACPDMTLETDFLAMLENVASYKIENDRLLLFNERKKVIAKFTAIK